MPDIYVPVTKIKHKCDPPVDGGLGPAGWLVAATPTEPIGSLYHCSCGRWYLAANYVPLLPGWKRISQRRAMRMRKKGKVKWK